MAIITLLTDFGVVDEYVGVMKGVILSTNPAATVIDISHAIDPQDVYQAAWMLRATYKYFPRGTLHVVVVDPGVGGDRAIIAFETNGHFFLGPDNGVLTPLTAPGQTVSIVAVQNEAFFCLPVSRTFHGRDIFAPVAGHISKGVPLAQLGPRMASEDLVRLDYHQPFISDNGQLHGIIVTIDRFGNLITDIEHEHLQKFCKADPTRTPAIMIGSHRLNGLALNYQDVGPQRPLAIIGSRGCLELAVNLGNARQYFGARKGDVVKVVLRSR